MSRFHSSARIVLVLAVLLVAPGVRGAELDGAVADAVATLQTELADPPIAEDAIAITVIDLQNPDALRSGSYRGDQPVYPASVVKLFYLAYAQRLLEDKALADSDELQRGLRDMIVQSSNDATSYILDAITDAPNGSLLPAAEMRAWEHRRNAVNRFFADLGYSGINVNQKTYCDGPYGRERIFLGSKYENRNKLTTDATARLLAEIAQRRFITPARSEAMLTLLSRDRAGKPAGPDDQAHGFIAGGLPAGMKVWSKAGWTSTARHDAAYVESEDGSVRAVFVIFTTGQSRRRELLPRLATLLLERLDAESQDQRGQPVGR